MHHTFGKNHQEIGVKTKDKYDMIPINKKNYSPCRVPWDHK